MRNLAALLLAALMSIAGGGYAADKDKAPPPADYQLGAGDTIRIQVFQNPDLTLETR